MKASSKDTQTVKVVLVGEAGTGKTSIIQKYCKDVFQESTNSTLGSSHETKVIRLSNQKELKLNIWDTAGQEAFRSVNKIFYKDANIVVLVYDITNRESFDEIVNYWYGEIKSHVKDNVGELAYNTYNTHNFSDWNCWEQKRFVRSREGPGR